MTMSPTRRRVATAIASAGTPTVHLPEAIADDIGVTRRAVENVLRSLEQEGAIVWQRKSPFGERRPYWIVDVVPEHGLWFGLKEVA